MNPVMLIQSLRKLLPKLRDDDLQGSSNKEISRSKILDMVCAISSFENINKEILKNRYRAMCVKCASSTRQTDRHYQCSCKTKRRRKGWEKRVKFILPRRTA
jgi:hypothetical protein